MGKEFRKAMKRAILGLFMIMAAAGFAGTAHAALVIVDHFDDNTFATSSIWLNTDPHPINPHSIFTEPVGSNMHVWVEGDTDYSFADSARIVSQEFLPSGFRGGLGIVFSDFSVTNLSGEYPYFENQIYPNIGVAFSSSPGVSIGIYRGYTPGAPGGELLGEHLVFAYRNTNAGQEAFIPYVMDAYKGGELITGGVLYLERDDVGIHAGWEPSIHSGEGEGLEFTPFFSYSNFPGFDGQTRMVVSSTPGYDGDLFANIDLVAYEADAVPIPSSLFLLAPGLAGLAIIGRRIKK